MSSGDLRTPLLRFDVGKSDGIQQIAGILNLNPQGCADSALRYRIRRQDPE